MSTENIIAIIGGIAILFLMLYYFIFMGTAKKPPNATSTDDNADQLSIISTDKDL